MADYLTINGTPVEVVEGSGEGDNDEIGDAGRAINGNYLQRVIANKREWECTSRELTTAEKLALLALITPGVKTISGTMVDGYEIPCFLHRGKSTPIRNKANVLWVVTFKVVEK